MRFSWAVGRWRRFSCSPHRRDIGLAPSSCRLPLKGGVMRIGVCKNSEDPEPQNFPLAWQTSAIPAQSLPLAGTGAGIQRK